MGDIHIEAIGCPACGASDPRVVLRDLVDVEDRVEGHYAIGECGRCGFVFLAERPDRSSLHLCYRQDYHALTTGERGGLRGYLYRRRFDYRVRRLERYLSEQPGRVLEVGCGDGSFLKHLAGRWLSARELVGVDPGLAPTPVVEGRVRLIGGQFETMALDGTFQAILLYDVLEHVHDPLSVIREASVLLARGGKLVVQVPNWDSWWRRAFPRHWEGLQVPRHMSFLTPASLKRLVESAGLDCRQIVPVYDPGELSVSLCNWIADRFHLRSRPRDVPFFVALAILSAPVVAAQVYGFGNAGEMELVAETRGV